MSALSLNLLGSFGAHVDGHPMNNPGVKAQALLIYLAVEQHPQRREQLLTLLWPGMPEKSARHNLSQAIYALRQVFPEDTEFPLLLVDRQTVQLNPTANLIADLHQLGTLLETTQTHNHRHIAECPTCIEALEQAIDLYQGAFISDFYLEDSNEFNEWAEAVREDYRRRMMNTLSTRSEIASQNGDYEKALTCIDRQLITDNLSERAHRQKMEVLALAGRRVEALRQYRVYAQLLAEQLGVSPSQMTIDLFKRIQADDPLRSYQRKVKHNLPPTRTSFIGREEQMAEVKVLLAEHHLVTLTGPGGVGKTRLSLQVAGQVLGDYPNGAWLVELAGLSDPQRVPRTVASALNLPEFPGKSIRAALVDFLVRKQLLLVLDNCEHLLEACSSLVDRLLNTCPLLTILASSREILGVRGEMTYRVPPLALPDLQHQDTSAQLNEYDAVRLFIERGQVVASDFAITERNTATIAKVVRHLDGLPLAIELAASRLRLLSVEQIAQRLDDTFRLLTNDERGTLPRHQALRASLDWSYNLLSEPEQALLRRLSVFAGSWRLLAAEKVCTGCDGSQKTIREDDVLDLLTGLVDKSFVMPVSDTGRRNHYQMLETVRQYAHEKLVDEGESQGVRDRHLAYYLEWVEEQAPKIRGPEQVQRLNQFERELDNLRLAMEWGLQRDIEAQLKICTTLIWFWHIHSREPEGIEWLNRGLGIVGGIPIEENIPLQEGMPGYHRHIGASVANVDPLVRTQAMVVLGFFRWLQFYNPGDTDHAPEQAKNLLEEAISRYQEIGAKGDDLEICRGLAWAQLWLGHCLYIAEGELNQARELARRMLEAFRTTDDSLGVAECLQLLGFSSRDPAEAIMLYQEQLTIHEANQDSHGMGNAHYNIGYTAVANGNYEIARQAYEASLVHARRINHRVRIVENLAFLGDTYQYCGNMERADEYIQQSLSAAYELGMVSRILQCLRWKFQLQVAKGRYDQVVGVNEEALRLAQKTGIPNILVQTLRSYCRLARLQTDAAQVEKDIKTLLKIYNIPSNRIALELGHLAIQKNNLVDAIFHFREVVQNIIRPIRSIAPVLDGLALFALKKGLMEEAARLFGSRWCRGYTHFLSPIEKEWRAADWNAMRNTLGDDQFEQLYEIGRVMTFAQAVDLAREIVSPDP